MNQPRDDSLMSRFDRAGLRRFTARDAVVSVLLAAFLLVLFEGHSVLRAGERMNPGVGRTAVVAVGHPSSWIADRLPLASLADKTTAWLSPDPSLDGGGFDEPSAVAVGGSIPAVTPEAFSPQAIGAKPHRRRLKKLLVTGDSMSMPLDSVLAKRLVDKQVDVVRDAHLGSGISTTLVVDWGKLSRAQIKKHHPDAVVIFIGANDGFPIPGAGGDDVGCCSADWAALYANRVRQVANAYRQGGDARVYWITLPTPRNSARRKIARVINAAIAVGAQPWASQVHVIDTVPIFTPGDAYRDAMTVDGKDTIVRQADGIHLNDAGSTLLATEVLRAIEGDFVL
ncbi:MAG: uncharacterized protein QOE65_1559 [Solirubrobacteraceae bacterium]|jgi:hypothetical protein|nr:uncharacterized protein [Solirubrobacteraceae bacterium]